MRRTLILLSASLLTLTACTTKNDGTPSPSGHTPSQSISPDSTDNVPGPGVPKVEKPIDIAHFKQTPCDALTAPEVTELLGSGVTPKPEVAGTAGPQCRWDSPRVSQAGVGVIFTSVDKRGITRVYEAQGKEYPFFKPLPPVDGYPIVAYDASGDQTSHGNCTVALGTSNEQTVDIDVTLSEENVGKKDPCAAAHDVAAQILNNLRKAK
ncbi:DUF3558 domain-containing protein [Amycolatopsis sp. SID8362]|uniref:DUF3558 domain-containing protein n=1 Tax=Amycolatopsis sp. SID8362 TaxID=2690346 RepID=UPI001370AA34|nr:DUF3558 domain-containing protein [Amycolatopsis sp. SID8362]NBH11854.1 DUF3558 domain-containing protein [Amycolatopsis sp. SID8362]NED48545.1 DUF3558 domain-containing protein [Amycolatopsis sp. SID8362]